MTDAKKLKKKIRTRAQKTGESYSAARRHVVAKLDAERESKTVATAAKAQKASAVGAVSEERCIEKTGHGFAHWFRVLDRFGARKAGHTKAARHLQEEHEVTAWYSQAITVAYERAHGLREVNQLCTGDYETSVSRVLPVDLETARAALGGETGRRSWLTELEGEPTASLRSALGEGELKPMKGGLRLRYRPDSSVVELELHDKADGRSTLIVRHRKIADRETMESLRDGWRRVLDRFRAHCRQH